MKNKKIINNFEQILNSVVNNCVEELIPLALNEKTTIVGKLVVYKNDDNLYTIYDQCKNIIFQDIITLDIAVLMAQKYNYNLKSDIKKIVKLEKEYSKHYLDMVNYKYCIKKARACKDYERVSILENKYSESKLLANRIKKNILCFKFVK